MEKVTRAELHEVYRFTKGVLSKPKLGVGGKDIKVHKYKGKSRRCSSKRYVMVSWNVMRNYHAAHVKKTIADMQHALNPDIWLFQEVPYRKGHPIWKTWPQMRGLHILYVPDLIIRKRSKVYDFDSAGLFIASRHPIKSSTLHMLPMVTGIDNGNVAHAALHIKLACANLNIYNVHLENACRPSGRLIQLKALLKHTKKEKHSVLGGDFNTMFGPKRESVFRALDRAGYKNATGHKHGIISGFDYFFVRGGEATSFRMQQRGSDHNAVLLVMEV